MIGDETPFWLRCIDDTVLRFTKRIVDCKLFALQLVMLHAKRGNWVEGQRNDTKQCVNNHLRFWGSSGGLRLKKEVKSKGQC